jgi:hypothetical protein
MDACWRHLSEKSREEYFCQSCLDLRKFASNSIDNKLSVQIATPVEVTFVSLYMPSEGTEEQL